jgi:hypothetical protein
MDGEREEGGGFGSGVKSNVGVLRLEVQVKGVGVMEYWFSTISIIET